LAGESEGLFPNPLQAVHDAIAAEPPQIPPTDLLRPFEALLWNEGRGSEAMACGRLLERLGQLSKFDLLLRGYWQLYLGQSKQALATFTALLDMAEARDDPDASLGLAFALLYVQNYKAAAQVFQSLLPLGGRSAAVMAPAAEALAAGKEPLEIVTPPLPLIPPPIGELLLIELLHGAEEAFARVDTELARLDSNDEVRLPLVRTHVRLALDTGRHDATMSLKAALEEFTSDGHLWWLYGVVSRRNGEIEASADCFEIATRGAPLFAMGWAACGASRTELQNLDGARRAFRSALFLDDTLTSSWSDLGQLLSSCSEWQESRACFTRAIELGEDLPSNRYRRAHAAIGTGDVNAAVRDLEHIVVRYPNDELIPKVYELLGDLRESAVDEDYVLGDEA